VAAAVGPQVFRAWQTILKLTGRVLGTNPSTFEQVLQEMRRLRSDPKYFEQGTPMGSEVLEWLQVFFFFITLKPSVE